MSTPGDSNSPSLTGLKNWRRKVTKLEELKKIYDDAVEAYYDAIDNKHAVAVTVDTASINYRAELEKQSD